MEPLGIHSRRSTGSQQANQIVRNAHDAPLCSLRSRLSPGRDGRARRRSEANSESARPLGVRRRSTANERSDTTSSKTHGLPSHEAPSDASRGHHAMVPSGCFGGCVRLLLVFAGLDCGCGPHAGPDQLHGCIRMHRRSPSYSCRFRFDTVSTMHILHVFQRNDVFFLSWTT